MKQADFNVYLARLLSRIKNSNVEIYTSKYVSNLYVNSNKRNGIKVGTRIRIYIINLIHK